MKLKAEKTTTCQIMLSMKAETLTASKFRFSLDRNQWGTRSNEIRILNNEKKPSNVLNKQTIFQSGI